MMAKLLLALIVVYVGAANAENPPFVLDRDGSTIADYSLFIESPYHCAADEYDRRPVPPLTFTPF